MSANLQFDQIRLPGECETLRKDVRAFLADEIAKGTFDPHRPGHGDSHDRAFSKRVGAKGWIGMTWPKKYGGQERTFLERYVVTEEFRVANAPVRLHFVADRQSGPILLEIRARAHQGRHSPAHLPRRIVLRHRHERAQFRLRSVRRQGQGDQGRGRLALQRQQDLDQQRACRRLHARPVPHLAADEGKPPPRPHAIPHRHEGARHHRQSDLSR